MADLLVFFKPKKETSKNSVLAPLEFRADVRCQQLLNQFVQVLKSLFSMKFNV